MACVNNFQKITSQKGPVAYQHTQNLKQILLKTRRAVRARVDFPEKNQPYCRPAVSRTAMITLPKAGPG
jgi:hypothetical protein